MSVLDRDHLDPATTSAVLELPLDRLRALEQDGRLQAVGAQYTTASVRAEARARRALRKDLHLP